MTRSSLVLALALLAQGATAFVTVQRAPLFATQLKSMEAPDPVMEAEQQQIQMQPPVEMAPPTADPAEMAPAPAQNFFGGTFRPEYERRDFCYGTGDTTRVASEVQQRRYVAPAATRRTRNLPDGSPGAESPNGSRLTHGHGSQEARNSFCHGPGVEARAPKAMGGTRPF
mmetsp:Transcript_18940/g.44016  ORF Transcript_18940/g.44016 Transcript_18940/m.44016 type:complete len:170 (+) Transcript_18940:131-640(+)|eukprot:CAMPEP_0182532528 /NCGR_PEP_ID=MMETSP1323-20130603/11883_1 /TAXON_ID=236787 /ORGANISM="Florenciella parvula, Strain RCC1693" /LENGTH=169 /DNA_ID=CAMNT_0024742285 /DNA_START=7 /DNA_END=516 /DNA_ORIENTATION=-